MKKLKTYVSLVSFLVVIGFLSTVTMAANIPEVKADKGLVVFYRLSGFKGKAIRFNLNHAEGSLGQLQSGTYLYKHLEPGEHKFWSQAISQDSITINVEAGKKYYVKGEVAIGVFAGRPQFTQMSESDALADLEKL
ncbi:MAG TPA: hypothetical protein DIC36_00205 [Gammaproteobacteria bacterium]|nr:hypothetical protein [Gammaproteobacteria bacterium]